MCCHLPTNRATRHIGFIVKFCLTFIFSYFYFTLVSIFSIFATEWYFWGHNDTLGKRTYGGKRTQTYSGCRRRDNRGCHGFFAENGAVTEMADFRVGDSGPARWAGSCR